MKETGLMFKAPLVCTILSGLKTQTRRAFSEHMMKQMRAAAAIGEVSNFLDEGSLQPNDLAYVQQFSPVGQPGDRIYVRETWQHANFPLGPYQEGTPVFYRADYLNDPHGPDGEKSPEGKYRHWSPAIHMPKAAARIWLEVAGVRVERLQSISEEDAKAEGAWPDQSIVGTTADYFKCSHFAVHPSLAFRMLWESTGGDWAANPWVWVIDFKRIEKPR
ncbi:hypothetical protein [Comamonas sp. E6]|uniref:hypothetical protein n=1 Tax=Comamonas sp. E6 TaxID=364029 RepID=UPI000631A988|nr:hypothetical protein [Comamonas sp. E6]GAO73335.1 hypothetical protein CSE6_036_47720 [Comamonas sp. E6]